MTISTHAIWKLARVGELLFAVGDHGFIAASVDGLSFQPIVVPASGDFHSIAITDRGLVAVGNYGLVVSAP